jgi:hypothetical protein
MVRNWIGLDCVHFWHKLRAAFSDFRDPYWELNDPWINHVCDFIFNPVVKSCVRFGIRCCSHFHVQVYEYCVLIHRFRLWNFFNKTYIFAQLSCLKYSLTHILFCIQTQYICNQCRKLSCFNESLLIKDYRFGKMFISYDYGNIN